MTPPTNATPKNSRLRRSLRRFGLGSGPLTRRSDRLQLIGRLLVVLSFLLAPSVAVATANRTASHLHAVAAAEAAERTTARAVVLADAAPAVDDLSGAYSPAPATVPVRATWSAPGGTMREGIVMVRPRTRTGAVVTVWVDHAGAITRPPLDPTGIADSAAAVGALPLIGLPVIVWLLYALLSAALDVHRDRRWAEDWAAVEPRWNSRLG